MKFLTALLNRWKHHQMLKAWSRLLTTAKGIEKLKRPTKPTNFWFEVRWYDD